MQKIRTALFYLSPLGGGVLGWLIGLSSHAYIWAIEVLMGVGAGCLISVIMLVLSIRARFKSDITFTKNPLSKD